MGYYSVVKGSITFNPPITYAEVRNSGFVITEARQNYVAKDIMLDSFGPNSEPEDEIYIILPASEDSYKVYDIVDDLKELVNILGQDREYQGHFEITGEGYDSSKPDIWRLRVKDGKVEKVHPKLVWPEDD